MSAVYLAPETDRLCFSTSDDPRLENLHDFKITLDIRKVKADYEIVASEKPSDEEVSRVMTALINKRWARATREQKAEQARKMVAGRRKAARKRARGQK